MLQTLQIASLRPELMGLSQWPLVRTECSSCVDDVLQELCMGGSLTCPNKHMGLDHA